MMHQSTRYHSNNCQSTGWLCLSSPDRHADKVTMTLDNRGLAYADGFFTTMGVIDGQILWQEYHQQRLISHAAALQLNIDDSALLARLQRHAQQLQQGMLKLIVTRAAQDIRGYGFTPSASGSACEIWLKSSALPLATAEQLRLPDGRALLMQPAAPAICLTAQLACLPPTLAGLKSLNRLDNVLASAELQRLQVTHATVGARLAEGLVRDMTGRWVEGTMSNVFYQLAAPKNSSNPNQDHSNGLTTGQWFTPSMTQSGVAGVLRQVLIDALSTTKNPVIIRPLADDDLPQLSQLFFCNALRGIMPVTALTLPAGEVIHF